MDFTLSPEIEDLRVRTRTFVDQHVLPLEAERRSFSEHDDFNTREVRNQSVTEVSKKLLS
jgi:acyl-CoA dehydrogenase